jgi:hypothetical protein
LIWEVGNPYLFDRFFSWGLKASFPKKSVQNFNQFLPPEKVDKVFLQTWPRFSFKLGRDFPFKLGHNFIIKLGHDFP